MTGPGSKHFLSARHSASLLAAFLLFIAGCSSVSYYSQAVSGHLSLMQQRQDVTALLDNPQTDPKVANQLRLAQEILDFAETHLHLGRSGSYRQVVITGQPAVTWNVVAAEEFSVEPRLWCFPIAGCVPYRGYFEESRASEFAEQLQAEGFDVDLSPVAAYSTLGWFDDPLLDTMLRYSESQLAGLLFHELAHQKLYVAGDTRFNEGFAEFVESVAVALWLEQTDRQQELENWTRRRQAEPQFTSLLAGTRDSLGRLYDSGQEPAVLRTQKQQIFEGLQQDYTRLVAEHWQGQDYFAGWMEGDLNNARLALAESYAGGACAFASLYQQAGENPEDFYARARQQAELNDEQRRDWLQQPCPSFASANDL